MTPAASINPSHDRLLRIYLHAKDACRPHQMGEVFAEDGVFSTQLDVNTDFHEDSTEVGLDAIRGVFKQLGDHCDNMYTVCLADTVHTSGNTLRCKWLVGMAERNRKTVRVAWGDYYWTFDSRGERARRLHVTMAHMAVLQPNMLDAMVRWLSRLPEPWCGSEQLLRTAPEHPALTLMHHFFDTTSSG